MTSADFRKEIKQLEKPKRKKKKKTRRSIGDMMDLWYADDEFAVMCMPHPSNDLSQNGRKHRLWLQREMNMIKDEIKLVANNYDFARYKDKKIRYAYIWFYKGNIPDRDNIKARMKTGIDAIAGIIGQDDKFFLDDETIRVLDSSPGGMAGIVSVCLCMGGERLNLQQMAAMIHEKYYSCRGQKKTLNSNCFH